MEEVSKEEFEKIQKSKILQKYILKGRNYAVVMISHKKVQMRNANLKKAAELKKEIDLWYEVIECIDNMPRG